MTNAESVELLVRLMNGRRPPPVLSHCLKDASYHALVEQLQLYPLAISLAGAYLDQRPLVSVRKYAAQCAQLLLVPRERMQADTTGNEQQGRVLAITLVTCKNAVDNDARAKGLEPVGLEVMSACAFLHANAIPIPLLVRGLTTQRRAHTLSAG